MAAWRIPPDSAVGGSVIAWDADTVAGYADLRTRPTDAFFFSMEGNATSVRMAQGWIPGQ